MPNTQSVALCACPSHKRESVLTFDGGGIRGLASLLILQALLVIIRRVENLQAQDQIRDVPLACHYFSFMFGTSTGGIIAIMLGRLRMRIEDCIDVYKRLGTKIFSKKQPFSFLGQNKYSCEKLEEFVKTVARSQSVGTYRANDGGPSLRDPGIVNKGEGESQNRARNRFVPCRVGVLAVQSNDGEQKIHMFRSYHNPTAPDQDRDRKLLRMNLDDQKYADIYKVARATSAAPYYFRSAEVSKVKYLDGGLIANNPSRYAWVEANTMHLNHPSGSCPNEGTHGGVRFLVSIGTGKRAEEQIKSGRIRKALSLITRGVQKMTDPEETHIHMEELLGNDHDIYHRFNVEEGLQDMKLDDCELDGAGNNSTYHRINDAVSNYLRDADVSDHLEELAQMLVDNRRQKCNPQNRGPHNLCVPGPLTYSIDERFVNENLPTSPNGTMGNGRAFFGRPHHASEEMSSELAAGPVVAELQPQSPVQDSSSSPVQSRAPREPHDSAQPDQGRWSPLPRLDIQAATRANYNVEPGTYLYSAGT